MKLYASTGRRAAALRQYQECVAVLQRELDVEPEAATRQLYRDIVASDPRQRAPATETPGSASAVQRGSPHSARGAPSTSARSAGDPPLAGRTTELAALRDALEQVCGRRGHIVSIVGEAGVGKTRLVSEIVALAGERDGRTIVGRAYETAQVLALGPWVDALRAGLATEPAALSGLESTFNGDFTGFASAACNGGRGIALRAPFVDNQVSPSQLSPVALNFLKSVPVSTDPCGKLTYGIPNNSTEHQVLGKADYTLNRSHTVSARYLFWRLTQTLNYGSKAGFIASAFRAYSCAAA